MAEKRHYILLTSNGFKAFYAGHGLGQIKNDAATLAGVVPSDIQHKTVSAREFYEELERAEKNNKVDGAKVKGIGHRWVVSEDDANPFGKAPDESNGGGVPPSLQGDLFAELEEAYPATMGVAPVDLETINITIPTEEEEAEHYAEKYENAHEGILYEIKGPGGVRITFRTENDEPPIYPEGYAGERATQVASRDTGELTVPQQRRDDSAPLPKIEDLEAELDRLRKDPSTYVDQSQEEDYSDGTKKYGRQYF